MKKSKTCPKCQSTDIVRIPGSVLAYGAGNNIIVGKTIFSAVTVTRYLCMTCGYIEEWVDTKEDRERVRKRYGKK